MTTILANPSLNPGNGKMGKKVFEAAMLSNNVQAVCGVDLIENLANSEFPIYSSFDNSNFEHNKSSSNVKL